MDELDLEEQRRYVGAVKAQAKSARNHLRTLTQMLADLEERLDLIQERFDALAIAQPEEAQRNGKRRYAAKVG